MKYRLFFYTIFFLIALFIAFSIPREIFAGYSSLYSFGAVSNDGNYPYYTALVRNGTTLYGITRRGGTLDKGIIFSIAIDASNYTILHDFDDQAYGIYPEGRIVYYDGKVYGTTYEGGSSNKGTVFSVNSDGTGFAVLHHFAGGLSDGAYPNKSGLTISGDTLYGTAKLEGANNKGVIYSIKADGTQYSIIHHSAVNDLIGPLEVSGSTLYGASNSSGDYGRGVIFKIDTNGDNFTTLHHFEGYPNDGQSPLGMTIDTETIYFVTGAGGSGGGAGTLGSMKTDGSEYAVLHNFDWADDGLNGAWPYGYPILVNNKLYGMTYYGGPYYAGLIYSIDPDGSNYDILYEFKEQGDGENPEGSAFIEYNNILHAPVTQDGAYNRGLIISYNLDETAPSLSLTAVSPDPTTNTTPTLSGTATDDLATVSTVEYQIDTTTGSWMSCTADDGTFDEASETFTCTAGTALSDGAHIFYVRATDSGGNTTSSGSEASDGFTIDTTSPIASSVSLVTKTNTSFTISWTTSEATSTQIEYGITDSYGSTTTESDTTTRVTAHTDTVSNLSACTIYSYRVVSRDAVENTGYSTLDKVRTNGCVSEKGSSFSNIPQIPTTASGMNQSGVFQTARGNAQGAGYAVTTILEENTFAFAAHLYSNTTPNTTFSLLNPTTPVSPAPFSLSTPQGTYFQMGTTLQEIWYDASITDGIAKIIPELQNKPSIISLSYTDRDLFTPGAGWFPESSLVLAHSIDGITWTILSTSVVDTDNNTVAALHKVGGYYMIMMKMDGGGYAPISVLGERTQNRNKYHEKEQDTEQNQEQEKNIRTKRYQETNQQQETNNQQTQPQSQNRSILQRFVGWVRSLF